MGEEISEACGIFGAVSKSSEPVFYYLYWGLLSLNHRGQQSYGFTTFSNGIFYKEEDLNLIPTDEESVKRLAKSLKGSVGISNARYATSGKSSIQHLHGGKQPLILGKKRGRKIAISYNGNLVNVKQLRSKLTEKFGKFTTDADTEVLGRQLLLGLEEYRGDFSRAVGLIMDEVEGAYSTLVIDEEGSLYAFRDVHGIRPFCFGKRGSLYAFASETPALEINNILSFDYVRPGELISVVTRLERKVLRRGKRNAICAFEFAYFSRPDSILNGTDKPVYKIREAFAKSLAQEYANKLKRNDIIISMPETADDAAYGLHEATGIPWERAVRKNRYVTRRAFISTKEGRKGVIEKKTNMVKEMIRGRRIALVEDSIVRGDTSKINIAKLRKLGAKRIDVYVTFPRITNPCFYGVDMATYGELIGSRFSDDEIAKYIGADSLNYQSIEGLVKAIGLPLSSLCLGCISGRYPTRTAQRIADRARESFSKGLDEQGRVYER